MNLLALLPSLLLVNFSVQEQDSVPAVPLVVKSPYLSVWLTSDNLELPGSWPLSWNKMVKGMMGMAKVDGVVYNLIGPKGGAVQSAKQTGLRVTPTQSLFTLRAGEVEVTLNFFTPIDPTDLKRLSLPASYIAVNVMSVDGKERKVDLYFDMTGEWISGNTTYVMEWDYSSVEGKVTNLDMRLKTQKVFQEEQEQAQWGTYKFFTDKSVTYQADDTGKMRNTFITEGKLDNTVDENYRRIDTWPGVAFARQMTATGKQSATAFYGIAHVRQPAIEYTDAHLNQLWESYFGGDQNKMIEFFIEDANDALKRANALDSKVITDAKRAGGDDYVKVVSAALRQAYGGMELVGTPEKPWMMVKEISSDGNCQTVDFIYPHFPVQYYLNPKIIRYLLDPLLDNQEKKYFPHDYCTHDLGFNYPRCIGHKDGRQEAMEVEESANIVVMMAAYVKATDDKEWANKHYTIAKQWTKYLVDKGLITGHALTTDDFLGPQINSTNLSVKAIVGIAAMAQLAERLGQTTDHTYYRGIAEKYAKEWFALAQDPSGTHLKKSYNSPNTWFMVYNLYADRLLETKLFDEKIYHQQDEWYKSLFDTYGLPLQSDYKGTKFDWSFFTAASSNDPEFRSMVYNHTAQYLSARPNRSPFPDFSDTFSGSAPGFINRAVIGGVFAPLTIKH